MAELVTDCPRCRARHVTFDIPNVHHTHTEYGWQRWYEAFSVCRNCRKSTIFVLKENAHADYQRAHKEGILNLKESLNNFVIVEGHISLRDAAAVKPPEHLDADIETVFKEGATCLAVGCYNAAGTMFRLCVDLATKSKLPDVEADGPNRATKRSLGLRLAWLFDNGHLPETLRELSAAIKEDGNDGAHAGTLKKEDAEDLQDFTVALLERLYTEPKKLILAKQRREGRRGEPTPA